MTALTLDEVRSLIDARIREYGSMSAYARRLGIKPQQLHRSLGPGSTPDGAALADLGLKKTIVYCKKDSNNDG